MSSGEDRVGAVQQTVLRTFGGYHAVRGHLADLQAGNVPPKDKPSAFHFGLLNVLANNFKELSDAYDALYELYTVAVQERGKFVSHISRQARKSVHVGCSPLTNNIYAGYVLEDGQTWSDTNKTDVTHEAIGAVCEHAERFGKPITVNRNGRPAYRLRVEVLFLSPEGVKP